MIFNAILLLVVVSVGLWLWDHPEIDAPERDPHTPHEREQMQRDAW